MGEAKSGNPGWNSFVLNYTLHDAMELVVYEQHVELLYFLLLDSPGFMQINHSMTRLSLLWAKRKQMARSRAIR